VASVLASGRENPPKIERSAYEFSRRRHHSTVSIHLNSQEQAYTPKGDSKMLQKGEPQLDVISQNTISNQDHTNFSQKSDCHHHDGPISPKKFYIFGNNISHSMSPTLHNAGFKELGLPHHYSIHETSNVDINIHNLMSQPDFGGASVTFPHKLQIGKYLSKTSESAKLIGAVNTVVVRDVDRKRVLI
jgi:hypothetical protein